MPNLCFVIFQVPLIMVTWFSMSLNYALISFLSIIIYGGHCAFQDRWTCSHLSFYSLPSVALLNEQILIIHVGACYQLCSTHPTVQHKQMKDAIPYVHCTDLPMGCHGQLGDQQPMFDNVINISTTRPSWKINHTELIHSIYRTTYTTR